MKIKKINIFPINFQFILLLIMVFMALIPALIDSKVLNRTFNQVLIENRRTALRNKSLILVDKIISSGYLSNVEKDKALEVQLDTVADIFDGRIIVIDSGFSIIKDTFNISLNKKTIAKEVIRTFQGENIDKYIAGKNYIIQSFPIYSQDNKGNIEGALLIISSTENFKNLILNADDKAIIFTVVLAIIFVLFSIFLSGILIRPFNKVRNKLINIADGRLDYNIDENTYILTHQISKTINTSLAKLRLIDQSRDEFVSNVSHELKTPITSIRVLADSLLSMEEVPNELYKEFMEDISKEIDRESKIIDDLLTLVKLDKANVELNIEMVNINDMINAILKRLRPIAATRNIELSFESMREVEAQVDETKLSLAINNLIENAIKYNKDEGYVKVNLDADHKFFYIKVIDNGIGIPQDLQELVFDRFYRVDKARSRQTGGTGLGLSIAKNFVLKHGGIIRLNSIVSEGTTFTVRIPLIQKNKLVDTNAKN